MKRTLRDGPVLLALITLLSCVVILVWDAQPDWFPAHAHDYLGAFALGMIAVAYVAWQIRRRAAAGEMWRAILLSAAFIFWAANQLWPDLKAAMLFNDIAIGLFVLDVFLTMIAA